MPEHIKPTEATPTQEHILQFFKYDHLPSRLAMVSKPFCDLERAVTAINDRAYFGLPKSLDAMWADPQYRDRRSVKVGQARVIRTRPRIPTGWKLTIDLAYVESMIDEATVREFASVSGALIGLGDFRQRFGRYEVV